MPRPRLQDLDDQVGELIKRVELLDQRHEEIETALMMNDPGSVVAAEAYEGLRRQVVDAATGRMAHLAQLVQLAHALSDGASLELLRKYLAGWMEQAGLVVVDDLTRADAEMVFEVLGGDGDGLELIEPAYLDARTDRVVRQGRARRVASPAITPSAAEKPDAVLPGPTADDQAGKDSE